MRWNMWSSSWVGLLLALGLVVSTGCKKETPKNDVREPAKRAATSQPSGKKYAERMAKEHKRDAPVAAPAAKLAPRQPVEGEEVVYGKIIGAEIKGYVARPKDAKGKLPGLIVIHEWWGLNENIKAMTRRLAGEGYIALAVDMYQGKHAKDPKGAMALMKAAMKRKALMIQNLKAAHRYLKKKAKATKIGSIGWCFGGGLSLQAGLALGAKNNAVVIYYGHVSTVTKRQLKKLKAPLLGIFGAKDTGIPIDGVRKWEAMLKKLKKKAEVVVYPEAEHAFANPSGKRYRAKDATDAWDRTLAFFKASLQSED